MNENDKYSDMLGLPRHVSILHPQMAIRDRAKIFAAFAALKGFDNAVHERECAADAAACAELAEDAGEALNIQLQTLRHMLDDRRRPTVRVSYFDRGKERYVKLTALLTDVNAETRTVTLGGVVISVDNIREIEMIDAHARGEQRL